jgi:translation initiation factor 1
MKIDGDKKTVRVFLETKGRKGKAVTLITGIQHNPTVIEEIATILKQYCGAGGTVKGRDIEIQGDQRKKVSEKLVALNFLVK